jgi:hypothetical protein
MILKLWHLRRVAPAECTAGFQTSCQSETAQPGQVDTVGGNGFNQFMA